MSDPKVEILKKSDGVESMEMESEQSQVIQINDNANAMEIFSPVEIVGLENLNQGGQQSAKGTETLPPSGIQIKIGSEIVSNGNVPVNSEPSTSQKQSSEEDNVFLIPPLLRIRHYATEERIPISIEEIRRRIGPPESLSQSLILSLLRLNKERSKHLRKALNQFGIKELPSKSSVVSSFSRLSEAEATSLAEDYYYLASRFMKVQEMHYSLVNQNESNENFNSKANSTRLILEQILAEIEKRDSDLNFLTHGFSPLILRGVFNILIEILTFKEKDMQEITLEVQKDDQL